MSLSLPKCVFCKHYYFDEENNKMCCDAFPNGITREARIANREAECKKGIKFEKESKHPS